MNVLVCKADHESVLGGVVLSLVLGDHASARLVIGLTLSATTPFGLVASMVGLVLRELHARHWDEIGLATVLS